MEGFSLLTSLFVYLSVCPPCCLDGNPPSVCLASCRQPVYLLFGTYPHGRPHDCLSDYLMFWRYPHVHPISVCLFTFCLTISPAVFLSDQLSVWKVSTCVCVWLPAWLSACLTVSLFVCWMVPTSLSVYLPFHLSIYISIYTDRYIFLKGEYFVNIQLHTSMFYQTDGLWRSDVISCVILQSNGGSLIIKRNAVATKNIA